MRYINGLNEFEYEIKYGWIKFKNDILKKLYTYQINGDDISVIRKMLSKGDDIQKNVSMEQPINADFTTFAKEINRHLSLRKALQTDIMEFISFAENMYAKQNKKKNGTKLLK